MNEGRIFLVNPECQIILASASPRRQEMLRSLGIEFTCQPSAISEPVPNRGESPIDYALRAAKAKALAHANELAPNAAVLAADTVVACRDRIYGKPENLQEALAMLRNLNGRAHVVVTSLILFFKGSLDSVFEQTRVVFSSWPDNILEAYARTGESMDKAGAYAIQGQGSFLIQAIEGSYTNVIGLPLEPLVKILLAKRLIEPL